LKEYLKNAPGWLKLSVLGLVLMLPTLGLRPLCLPDEGRYAEVAREMIVTGDWITPHLNFSPHFTKPPLTYWLTAISLMVFGKNAFAARLTSALSLIGTAIITYLLAMELGRRRSAFIAGLILLTSIMPFAAGNLITTDMLLTFWETLAIFMLWRWYNTRPKAKAYLYGAYAALGLAFLTKGPVGVLVPLMAFSGYCVYVKDWSILKQGFTRWSILIFSIIAFPWFITIILIHKGLLAYLLGNEVVGRAFTSIHHRNNTFLIYPVVLTLGFLPWVVFLPSALKRAFTVHKIRERKVNPEDAFLLSWILLPLVFFSIVKSRLPLYVLDLFVPLAILTAAYLVPDDKTIPTRRGLSLKRAGIYRLSALMAVALLCLNVYAAHFQTSRNIYPIIKAIKEKADGREYKIYSNRDYVYTINFYLDKKVERLTDVRAYLRDKEPCFLVLNMHTRTIDPPAIIVKHSELITKYFEYWLFYRPGTRASSIKRQATGKKLDANS